MLSENIAFLLYQLSVDDDFDDDTFDAVVNDDSGRCEINTQDLAESAARHIESIEAENAALKEENERQKFEADSMMVALKSAAYENTALKARVAELEAEKQISRFTGYIIFNDDGSIDKECSGMMDIYGLHCGSLDEILEAAISYFEGGDIDIEPIMGGYLTFTAQKVTHQDGQMTFPETGQWDFPPHWEMDISVDKVDLAIKDPSNEA
jgi:hypothetical protein